MAKRKPIRTLAQAERWCRKHNATLSLHHWGHWRYSWDTKCAGWEAEHAEFAAQGPTPWAAVEKLRRKMEGR